MTTDILTQLQTCYDQLLTQFFSTISYLSQRHPLVAPDPIPGDPYTNPPRNESQEQATTDLPFKHRYIEAPLDQADVLSQFPLEPVPPSEFQLAQQELAEDLVRKGQQIESLIKQLPGLGRGESQQADEIKLLIEKVHEMDKRRRQKRKEMKECVRRLDDVVLGMATSINYEGSDESRQNGYSNHLNGN